MKITEAQLRKVIREELLKEMHEEMPPEEEEGKLYPGAIAGGVGAAGVLVALERALNYVQTHEVGGQIAQKIGELSNEIQQFLQE